MARAVTVTDDGYMWYGSDYEFGALAWQPRLYEWYFDNDWILPTNVFSAERGAGLVPGHRRRPPTATSGRRRRVGARPPVERRPRAQARGLSRRSNVPDVNMNTLVVDPDDTVWIGADGGLYRYFPATQTWTNYPAAGGGINHIFLDDTVTPRAIYAATPAGSSSTGGSEIGGSRGATMHAWRAGLRRVMLTTWASRHGLSPTSSPFGERLLPTSI